MEGINQVSSTVSCKQSAIHVKVKFTTRIMINKSSKFCKELHFHGVLKLEEKEGVVKTSRVMNLRECLRTFLVEVNCSSDPTRTAIHIFRTASAVASGVSWTAAVFVE
ncbi:hypothetical protein GQ457_06G024460 [Hibiscus cannabinus]